MVVENATVGTAESVNVADSARAEPLWYVQCVKSIFLPDRLRAIYRPSFPQTEEYRLQRYAYVNEYGALLPIIVTVLREYYPPLSRRFPVPRIELFPLRIQGG